MLVLSVDLKPNVVSILVDIHHRAKILLTTPYRILNSCFWS